MCKCSDLRRCLVDILFCRMDPFWELAVQTSTRVIETQALECSRFLNWCREFFSLRLKIHSNCRNRTSNQSHRQLFTEFMNHPSGCTAIKDPQARPNPARILKWGKTALYRTASRTSALLAIPLLNSLFNPASCLSQPTPKVIFSRKTR
jgi:hypothetical protein